MTRITSNNRAEIFKISWKSLPIFRRLNLLDFILLAVISTVVLWFYYRLSVGINYQWQWRQAIELIFTSRVDGQLPYFFQGLLSTLRISLWGIVLALLFGIFLGLARYSSYRAFRLPAVIYIQLVRNIPPLVFVFIFFFFISNQLIPLLGLTAFFREHSGQINALQQLLFGPANLWENQLSGILCVALLSAAYIGEIIRSGLEQIPKGQWESAYSLGLSPWIKMKKIIAPQVMTIISPMLAGQMISLVKDSSIVSLISIQEMTFVGSELANSSGLIFEIWLIIGSVYFLLCLSLSVLFRFIEQRSRKHLKH